MRKAGRSKRKPSNRRLRAAGTALFCIPAAVWVLMVLRTHPAPACLWLGFLYLAGAYLVLGRLQVRGVWALLFPLTWLAASPGLMRVCGEGIGAPFAWAVLALLSLGLVPGILDLRRLWAQVAVWLAMTVAMLPSLLMPLAFLPALLRPARNRERLAWFAPLAVLLLADVLMILRAFRAWTWGWLDVYDFLSKDRYFSFAILAFLSFVGTASRGSARSAILQFFLVLAGWAVWGNAIEPGSAAPDAIGVTFILLAGLGLRVLREELLDDSWHGRAVWAVLGIALALALFNRTWNLYNTGLV